MKVTPAKGEFNETAHGADMVEIQPVASAFTALWNGNGV